MNIYVAAQNTIAQFEGFQIEDIRCNGTTWTIRVKRDYMELTFEIDERVGVACVLDRKNIGYKSMSRFMNTFIEEVESTIGDEDPVNPLRD